MSQIEAVRITNQIGLNFEYEYPEQFVLSYDSTLDLPGWDYFKLGGMNLWRAPDARTKRLYDTQGIPLGWLLGEAVDGDGQYLSDPVTVPVSDTSDNASKVVEEWVEALAGRYAVILLNDNQPRLYQDPIGDFSVVWDPETGIVASSVLLALTRQMEWNEDFDRQGVLDGRVHFSLGHTADARVQRMLPNHYLDLTTWTLKRHWPRSDTEFSSNDADLGKQVDAISERLTSIMRALVTNTSCLLPISGGRDSRNLTGVLGPAAESLVAGFAIKFHKMSRIDTEIGAAIAKRIDVPFLDLPSVKSTRPQRLRYYRNTGYADGGITLKLLGSHLALPPGNLVLRGNAMELLRANQWNNGTIWRDGEVNTAFGVRRLLIVRATDAEMARYAPEYEAWADTIPENARKRQLDLAFCEHLLPNTLGIRHFGQTQSFFINPFSCRRLIHLAMQISPELRAEDHPNQMLLERNCAHLSDIPFEGEVATGAVIPDA